jgi:DNA replication protein DnaC
MVVDVALEQALRTLKLSGMLQTLESDWRRLAPVTSVISSSCRCCVTTIARRIRRAHFEQQVTLEEFDFAASPKLPAAQIRDLAALR